MKYYQAIDEYHDYFTGNTVVKDELITPKERDTKYRYLADECFRKVEISRAKTFTSFGVRFPMKEFAKHMPSWKLTKEEAEKAIMKHLRNIAIIAYDYTGQKYITMSWHRDGGSDRCMMFNDVDAEKRIDIYSLFDVKNDTEQMLLDEAIKIKDILDDYCPEEEYFSAWINDRGQASLNNRYWKHSENAHRLNSFCNDINY